MGRLWGCMLLHWVSMGHRGASMGLCGALWGGYGAVWCSMGHLWGDSGGLCGVVWVSVGRRGVEGICGAPKGLCGLMGGGRLWGSCGVMGVCGGHCGGIYGRSMGWWLGCGASMGRHGAVGCVGLIYRAGFVRLDLWG